ncbi:outer spore wall protein RRT8 [Diplogelasinospora grovesii]|uniref:Outer spore wall protein RRT8 n=1 Tax=Diplogelasinospora grovesii TaxID=303347 RepID=A0AAN6S1S4_9PEZI|nr:outer spore wall protein RRT8 [Diplogelasinospora grovesii]
MSSSADSGRGSALLHKLISPFQRPLDYLYRALRSGAYPLQGIWYFLRHPAFYPLFIGRLVPLSIMSFLVYFILFTFAFLPQLAFLAIFHGWVGGLINATVLVLGEGLVIIQGLFEGFFVDECRVDVFDATLINEGLTDLVAPHRILFPDAPNSVKMLGKPTSRAEYQPWSLVQIAELIVFLPLNLIPYVGTPAFIMITGTRVGKLSHHRWFKLRGLSKQEIKRELSLRSWEYVWFGTVAMILELIPVFSFFFLLTTAAGSALWVAKIEERARVRVGRPITADDQVAARESEGPIYHDDPV